ncbi:MAG: hypothetical protein ABIJ46_03305 [bacterium]
MCTNCLTDLVRELVPSDAPLDSTGVYTIRVGRDLSGHEGLIIVSSQETIAHFEFFGPDGSWIDPRNPPSSLKGVCALVYVDDPADWVSFMLSYAEDVFGDTRDFREAVDVLQDEALELLPRLSELMTEAERHWSSEEEDLTFGEGESAESKG